MIFDFDYDYWGERASERDNASLAALNQSHFKDSVSFQRSGKQLSPRRFRKSLTAKGLIATNGNCPCYGWLSLGRRTHPPHLRRQIPRHKHLLLRKISRPLNQKTRPSKSRTRVLEVLRKLQTYRCKTTGRTGRGGT